ncbi:MAG: type II toxin-antitoxin system RelB/DinJ family antitoxin [Kiritimatiellae bacterium]|nr:type II toxin-antitoxin system RelB/DinJ family antitoxin [Kiritimatiellia bacterium]
MATSTLQIRVDSKLRREADELFAGAGLDLSSAVRLFLRQSVIRRRLPFEVVSENPDPFWSEANQRVLRESIASFERGDGQRHDKKEK